MASLINHYGKSGYTQLNNYQLLARKRYVQPVLLLAGGSRPGADGAVLLGRERERRRAAASYCTQPASCANGLPAALCTSTQESRTAAWRWPSSPPRAVPRRKPTTCCRSLSPPPPTPAFIWPTPAPTPSASAPGCTSTPVSPLRRNEAAAAFDHALQGTVRY